MSYFGDRNCHGDVEIYTDWEFYRWEQGGFAVKRRTTPKFWLVMIAVTAVVFGASLLALQGRLNRENRQLGEVTAYRDALSGQVEELSAKLEFAQTDDYVIRTARDELGMIMPDEVRYVNGAN